MLGAKHGNDRAHGVPILFSIFSLFNSRILRGAVALDHSSQSRRASYDERGHDLYEAPDVATQALLRAYPKLPGKL